MAELPEPVAGCGVVAGLVVGCGGIGWVSLAVGPSGDPGEESVAEFQGFGKRSDGLLVFGFALNFNVCAFDVDFRDIPAGVLWPALIEIAE